MKQLLLNEVCQRWRNRRDFYRPIGEPIRTADYEVAPISMGQAKDFVLQHHYSKSYPACRFRYGLFHRDRLEGVAVFSVPMAKQVLTRVFPGDWRESVELGRFVLLDEVPANGESWFKARCRELLKREGIIGIVAFSDDQPRTTAGGQTIFAGHIGTIYQASNAIYLGRGTARTLRLLPDGTVFSERAISKLRNQEQGWQYAARILVEHGAQAPTDQLAEWLQTALSVTRRVHHPGNHKYAWSLVGQKLESKPYPKRSDYVSTRNL